MALSETIKKLIPQWMVPEEVDRLRNEFEPPIDRTVFIQKACTGKNWKRMSKESRGPRTERVFDCEPFDGQLRCYVVDDGEGNIVAHYFQTE